MSDVAVPYFGPADAWFQSLFWWNDLMSLAFITLSLTCLNVSILVLVE